MSERIQLILAGFFLMVVGLILRYLDSRFGILMVSSGVHYTWDVFIMGMGFGVFWVGICPKRKKPIERRS